MQVNVAVHTQPRPAADPRRVEIYSHPPRIRGGSTYMCFNGSVHTWRFQGGLKARMAFHWLAYPVLLANQKNAGLLSWQPAQISTWSMLLMYIWQHLRKCKLTYFYWYLGSKALEVYQHGVWPLRHGPLDWWGGKASSNMGHDFKCL